MQTATAFATRSSATFAAGERVVVAAPVAA
jgi:hypothetical protein